MTRKGDKPAQGKLAGNINSIYKRYRSGFYRPNLLLTLEKRQMGLILCLQRSMPRVRRRWARSLTPTGIPCELNILEIN